MGEFFGTDGFRGLVGETLTAKHAFMIGRFLGCRKNGNSKPIKVVIGKDTRRSSYSLEYALSAGLNSSGADAYLMHVTTTPSVAFIAKTEGFDYGVMISASHNPYYDNGIKIISCKGEKVSDDLTDKIEDYLLARKDFYGSDLPYATKSEVGKTVDYLYGRSKYTGYLISSVARPFTGLRVVLDLANGSAYKIAPAVYESLGADIVVINSQPNGLNINQNCGSTDISSLKSQVVKSGADVGFAFDGDADRCICVSSDGEEINGDKILYILAKDMLKRGELLSKKVVDTVMSNLGLKESLTRIGVGVETTCVGDRFVYEKMRQSGIELGGESSGHIILSKYATTGDGILTSLKIAENLLADRVGFYKSLSEISVYPQITKNIKVKDKQKVVSQKGVVEAIALAQTFLGKCGRILVRPSGTEPVVRVMAEAKERADCFTAIDLVEEEILKADNLCVE